MIPQCVDPLRSGSRPRGHTGMVRIRWASALLIVVVVATIGMASEASGASAGTSSCGQVVGGIKTDTFSQFSFRVTASGTSCRVADGVAKAWGAATSRDGGAASHITSSGFRCARLSFSSTKPQASCVHRAGRITIYAAPAIVLFDVLGAKPTEITQGATQLLFDLRWSSWGGDSADATGKGTQGAGAANITTFKLRLTAYDIAKGCFPQSDVYYGKLRIDDLQTHQTYVEVLSCDGGQYR
jgi:hypothetical protein